MFNNGERLGAGLTLVIITLILCVGICRCSKRKVTVEYNPGCDIAECNSGENETSVNVVHIRAEGDKDCIHYVWSTVSYPVLLMTVTRGQDTKLTIDWARFLSANSTDVSGAVNYQPETDCQYSMALALTTLWCYNDTRYDSADMTRADDEYTVAVPFTDVDWVNATLRTIYSHSDSSVNLTTSYTTSGPLQNGSFSILLHAYGSDGRTVDMPRLLHTHNSSQFEFQLNHLPDMGMKIPRYAVEMAVVSKTHATPTPIQDITAKLNKQFDDEYSPGVFTMWTLHTQPGSGGGYIITRPVSYKHMPPSISSVSQIQLYPLSPNPGLNLSSNSLLTAFFNAGFEHCVLKYLNVSFGMPQDGGYNATNFVSWTAVMGVGPPPTDALSTALLIIIVGGLGLPVLLLLFGGGSVLYKKQCRKNTHPNTPTSQ